MPWVYCLGKEGHTHTPLPRSRGEPSGRSLFHLPPPTPLPWWQVPSGIGLREERAKPLAWPEVEGDSKDSAGKGDGLWEGLGGWAATPPLQSARGVEARRRRTVKQGSLSLLSLLDSP